MADNNSAAGASSRLIFRLLAGAALLLLVLYLSPYILGKIAKDHTELAKLQQDACEPSQASHERAHTLATWQGYFPFWHESALDIQDQILAQLVVRRECAAPPASKEVQRRKKLALSVLLSLKDRSDQGPDDVSFHKVSWHANRREATEHALLRWGYPEEVIALDQTMGAGRVGDSRMWAHRAIGDIPGALAALPGSVVERKVLWSLGNFLCLTGEVDKGLEALRQERHERRISAYAECLLRDLRHAELTKFVLDERKRSDEDERDDDLDYYEVLADVQQGRSHEAASKLDEGTSPILVEWVHASFGDWDALYFADEPLLGSRPLYSPPSRYFLSQKVPFHGLVRINERLLLSVAELLAEAEHPRQEEIHRRASRYFLVLACAKAVRWDPSAEQYFQRSRELDPDWALPNLLEQQFAFVHGDWTPKLAADISASLGLAVKAGPEFRHSTPWDADNGSDDEVNNYHDLGALLSSNLQPSQVMDQLMRNSGTGGAAQDLWRLTNLIVVGKWYGIDIERWEAQLVGLGGMRARLAEGRNIGM